MKEKKRKGLYNALEERAKVGVTDAQYQLGLQLINCSHGRVKGVKEGMQWLAKAAEKNDARAIMRLGYMYYKGQYRNKEKARHYYKMGILQGCSMAVKLYKEIENE